MTRHDDFDPDTLDQLVDGLPLEPGTEGEALEALFAAEAEAFLPAAEREALDAEAVRMAAFVRDTVLRDEAAAARRTESEARAPARGWARILAFSVGLHVVALGVLAFALHGERETQDTPATAFVEVDDPFERRDVESEGFADAYSSVIFRELIRRDLGEAMDDLVLAEQDTIRDRLAELDIDEPIGWSTPMHPPEVAVPMVRRGDTATKRRRLDLLGFNAEGTLRAVSRGLDVLALRQDEATGLFRGDDGESSIRDSALATLVFLGEGHTSRGASAQDGIVRRAVTGLRREVTSDRRVATLAGTHLGPLGVALAEDYMLAYGNLTASAVIQRRAEIDRVAAEARRRLGADARMDATERTWLVWALDAAQRAGASREMTHDRALFEGWVASMADPAAGDAADPQAALSVGTALLYAERGIEKPGFKRWSGANAAKLLGRLKPTGEAREGDSVAATATILLALQVAYRTY